MTCCCQVCCGDRVFECHQFMLSARSPVFQAMFQAGQLVAGSVGIVMVVGKWVVSSDARLAVIDFHDALQSDMTEAATRRVEIEDLQPEVVHDMLVYIYTGNTNNLNRIAGELLGAADKYQLEQLKTICEVRLGTNNET